VRAISAALMALVIAGCGGDGPAPAAGNRPDGGESPNQPPRILALRLLPDDPLPSDRIAIVVEALDPERDALEIEIEWYLNDSLVYAGPELEMPRMELTRGDQIYAVVYASDGDLEVEAETDSLEVANQPPRITRLELVPSTPSGVDHLLAVPAAIDAEGDPLEYVFRWRKNGRELEGQTDEVLEPDQFRRGDEIRVEVAAFDGVERGHFVSSASIVVQNSAPIILSEPSYEMAGSGRYRYALQAEDPDGDLPLRYELLEGPTNMKVDIVTGVVTWRVPEQASGSYDVELSVQDSHGGKTLQRYALDIRWEDPAPAPTAAPAESGESDEAPEPPTASEDSL
jgi:hypothetical protein